MKKIIILLTVLSLLLIAACTQTIDEVTASDDYVEEQVRIKGTVESPLKIGELSGYTLVDENNDRIVVASDSLPAEGDTVTAKGVLKKGPLGIGFYIETDN